MAKDILVVVDMQNDFIDGTLGTREAAGIVPSVVEYVRRFNGEVVFTRDTHYVNYLDTQEGERLPVAHCVKNTVGWNICDELMDVMTHDMKVFNKNTFGSVELCEYLRSVQDLKSVVLVGLCTDICVISNALTIKAFVPEVEIKVVADCCAGVTPESHYNALEAMKMCQVTIV